MIKKILLAFLIVSMSILSILYAVGYTQTPNTEQTTPKINNIVSAQTPTTTTTKQKQNMKPVQTNSITQKLITKTITNNIQQVHDEQVPLTLQGESASTNQSETIKPPRPYIYAGEAVSTLVPPNVLWSVQEISKEKITVFIFFPETGNTTIWKLSILYPEISFNNTEIEVRNCAPGAHIKVYSRDKLIIERIAHSETEKIRLPRWVSTTIIKVVYSYGWFSMEKIYPLQIDVAVVTHTYAGTPTIIVSGNPHVVEAIIGSKHYAPGTTIRLSPGMYRLIVYLDNGEKIETNIYVEPIQRLVVLIKEHPLPTGETLYTLTPIPSGIEYIVVTTDRVLKLTGPATLVLSPREEIIKIYSPYTEVKAWLITWEK